MNTKFIVNDYVLIWNLLFGASISEQIYKLKQKIWDTYKNEYNATFKDKNEILKDYKNFIPNDDTVYNIILETKDYEKLKKQAENSRVEIMQIWDKNKKENEYLVKNILRKKIPNYLIFVVNKELNIIDHFKEGVLIVGKEIDKKEPLKLLYQIHMSIVKNNIKRYKEQYEKFKKAILELAILNEYATRITGRSCYQIGSPSLQSLKRWLYPYWLMYLGIPKEEFYNYMMRDKIVFDADKYAYEKQLKRMDIEEFIEFCIRNQRYIVREPRMPKVDEEVL
ncbi:MAG: hypothetical protein IJ097_03010 [Bacilli bacterium]|nr:hypothetical protein [Bacilli bacterium]